MPPIYGHTFVSSMMEISYWSGRKFSKAQMMKQLSVLEKPTKDWPAFPMVEFSTKIGKSYPHQKSRDETLPKFWPLLNRSSFRRQLMVERAIELMFLYK